MRRHGVVALGLMALIALGSGGAVPARAQEPEVLETVAFLGVATTPVDAMLARHLRLPRGVGLVVRQVEPGSPADGLIYVDDVLHKLGDQLLVNPEQLSVLVRMRDPGDKVELTLVRDGDPVEVTAVLGERELPPVAVGRREGGWMQQLPPGIQRRLQAEDGDLLERLFQGDWEDRLRRLMEDRRTAMPDAPWGRSTTRRVQVQSDREGGRVTSDDDEHRIVLRRRGDEETVQIRDRAGEVLHDGPLTDEAMEDLAPEVREKVESLRGMLPGPDAGLPPVPRGRRGVL